jgi:hypothetical protein
VTWDASLFLRIEVIKPETEWLLRFQR